MFARLEADPLKSRLSTECNDMFFLPAARSNGLKWEIVFLQGSFCFMHQVFDTL